MAGEIIRPKDLTPRLSPVASELMVVDNSVNVGAATIKAIVEAGRPAASQAEAQAGTDAAKAMTPLTTKQSIAAEVGVSVASKAQGLLADSAVQPGALATVATTGAYGDLSGKPTLGGAAALNVGATAGTVAAGDDARLVAAVLSTRTVSTGSGLVGGGDLSANRTLALSSTALTSLGLADTSLQPAAIGTTVQAYSAGLSAWAALVPGSAATRTALALGASDTPQFIGLSIGAAHALAPVHVGNRNVNNSVDAMVLISRNVTGTSGNGHAFSDSSNVSRSGVIGYNPFDARTIFTGASSFDHFAGFQCAPDYGSSGTIGSLGAFVSAPIVSAGTAASVSALNVYDASGAGAVSAQYGAYIRSLTKGAVNYGIYTEGVTPSFFGGVIETGSGVKFPATQVPSANANTLDDYEEGAWTPTMAFGAGAGASVGLVSTSVGRFIKIGTLVFVEGTLTLSAKGTSTGALKVGGLPFMSSTVQYSSLNVSFATAMAGLTSMPIGQIQANANFAAFLHSGATGYTTLTDVNVTNTTLMYFSGVYGAAN